MIVDPMETGPAAEADVFPFAGSSYRGPAPQYARLRRERPVARVHTRDGVDAWLISRYGDVRAALADRRLGRAATVAPDAPTIGGSMTSTPEIIISMDDPDHARLRKLAAGAFTARRVEAMRPDIERVANALLDEMAATGPSLDLVDRFTQRLPLLVIGELLGVPMSVLDLFVVSAREFVTVDGGGEESTGGLAKLFDAMLAQVAEKRAHPGDDLLSLLIAARDDQDRLSEQELVTFAFTLVGAGFDTTASQLSSSVLALVHDHRDQWDLLVADPSRVPGGVEELLRHVNLYATDTAGNPRIATEDVEYAGVRISRGDPVVIAIAAANRDPDVFPDPDRLQVLRGHNPHLSFGHGMHMCIGKMLTRMEMEVAIDGLVRRFPTLRLDGSAADLTWREGEINHSLLGMPVTW